MSIFKELGYDPNILGAYRINNFTFKLKKAMESGKPLTQGVGGRCGKFCAKGNVTICS